jgi:hypothetical protein
MVTAILITDRNCVFSQLGWEGGDKQASRSIEEDAGEI